nr:Dna2/Cas4 domain-containing protein [Paludibacteraceae bacterium]
MQVNATLINLYHVCKRECWLHANGIRFEHTSDLVYDGKLIHET